MNLHFPYCLALLVALFVPSVALRGQVVISNPNLPVLYPSGVYRTPEDVFAMYGGVSLQIILTNVELRVIALASRTPSGPDELEFFNVSQVGFAEVIQNGISLGSFPADGSGPAETVTHGKVGNTTGTFDTEMLSSSLSGASPLGSYMLRESPTLASTGMTTITDLGGGLYRIDSFFDLFTELSIDGGATWMPDTAGPAHVVLVGFSPVITAQPQSQAVSLGSNATFCVNASGGAPLGYQWQFNGTNISGATNSCYTRTNVQSADVGNYTVEVSNSFGSVTSEVATLFVTPWRIGWSTMDGGGGTSTGAVFAVRGSIGQHDAGRLTNGTSVINGGFWGVVAVQTPGAPLLSIARTSTNTVAVFWPSPSTGFVLQQNTNAVSSVNWSNVTTSPLDNGTTKTVIVDPPAGNRFYRLIKP